MERRTSRRARLALSVAGIAALAVAAAPALAATQSAAGSFTEGPEVILEERQAGNNTIVHLTREAVITGTYTGVGQADQTAIIHADGSFNFHQTIDFVGTVCGQPVTLTFRVQGTGHLVEETLEATYSVIGPTETGRGNGTLEGVPGVGGTYEGKVHC
jgi:predicted proteasome-type protease